MAKKKITIEWDDMDIRYTFDKGLSFKTLEIIGILENVKLDLFANKKLRSQEEE